MAIALILSRGNKATVSKNRDLSLLDVDKMVSLSNRSLKEGDVRQQNMKLAVELSALKSNNPLTRERQAPAAEEQPADQSNRGTFQIFRLVRAAQLHYFQATRRQIQNT